MFDIKSKETVKKVNNYLASKTALLLDPSSSTRTVIRKLLLAMSIPTANIKVANNFQESKEVIETAKPQIIVAEYHLEKGNGLDLLPLMRSYCPSSLDGTFILVSEKNSPTIAALAAEEEVDIFVVKPFTYDSLQDEFMKALVPKLEASQYVKVLDNGKKLLKDKKYEEAMKLFDHARTLEQKPVLAFYFSGFVSMLLKKTDEAKKFYEEGLKIEPAHYRCLIGLYDVYMEQKQIEKAYEIAHFASQKYPVSPKKIPEFVRLTVLNKKYEELEDFYNLFINLEDRDQMIITYVGAGLVVCGKYLLQQDKRQKAVEIFSKAALVVNQFPKILMEIIQTLITANLAKEAQQLMLKIPETVKASPDFQVLMLKQANLSDSAPKMIQSCQELLSKGIKDIAIFEIMLKRSIELKRESHVIDQIVFDAIKVYPDKKSHFEELLKVESA